MRFGHRYRRYFAVDGGSGAHLLAALASYNPDLELVATARHADVLIVVTPVSAKLASSVMELVQALPRPAYVLQVDQSQPSYAHERTPAEVALLPGAEPVPPDPAAILAAARATVSRPGFDRVSHTQLQASTIGLPPKQKRELATELAVLSVGPIQAFTAGPLRLLLICDGEQVLSARVEAGYAGRGIAEAMTHVSWQAAADLAQHLDPLAQIAGRLAYVQALEQLQSSEPLPGTAQARQTALALERAQNHLWWCVNFARVVESRPLAEPAYALAMTVAKLTQRLWPQPLDTWIAPQASAPPPDPVAVTALKQLANDAGALVERVRRDRLLMLRTRSIGILTVERLRALDVSGPVLTASQHGAGDVHSRIMTRLANVTADLREADHALSRVSPEAERSARWDPPRGEAHANVEGPRGRIGLRLVGTGGDTPSEVEWQRPSAAVLEIVPDILAGQKLADAEVVVASLDLAMAEADG